MPTEPATLEPGTFEPGTLEPVTPEPASVLPEPGSEWLEADGLGGFASGTVAAGRLRRYHGLLIPALTPPTGRFALVAGFDAWVEGPDGPTFLSVQRYAPDVTTGPTARLTSFVVDPWPTWTFQLPDGTEIEQELFLPRDHAAVVLRWRVVGASRPLILGVRPHLTGRDIHALHHRNPAFSFDADVAPGSVRWKPYPDVPAVRAAHNGGYQHEPAWYSAFQLDVERARGFDAIEDAGAPGVIRWNLDRDAVLILGAEGLPGGDVAAGDALDTAARLRRRERLLRSRAATRLERAAERYLVRRGTGRTIVAGYPWFTDWGRDTFIAMRGLCLATGRWDVARQILLQWAGAVSEGMLPNRFVDQGDQPEFNSVDASLWYAVVVGEFLAGVGAAGRRLTGRDRRQLEDAVEAILQGYHRGTRFGIQADDDGLLAAGEAGVQLTWMDAKVGDWVVTPRIGKPVEIQALWINALATRAAGNPRWRLALDRARASFAARFWNPDAGQLFDVVDVDGVPGRNDASVRPNQIFAVGGLPEALLSGERAEAVVARVERDLLTPLGLRTLAPSAPGYRGRYEGGPVERDGGYHQGTVWPWLLGPFVEAWLRVNGATRVRREQARVRFLAPLLAHLDEAGLGHVAEIADGDAPHTPRGCPFQAWSVGEALRLERLLVPVPTPRRRLAAAR